MRWFSSSARRGVPESPSAAAATSCQVQSGTRRVHETRCMHGQSERDRRHRVIAGENDLSSVTGGAAMSEAAHLMAGADGCRADGCRADGRDDAAVIACSVRSPECFGTIFGRHGPAIFRYIARRLGADSAEDLVAETFLVAFRRRRRYDAAFSDARPWLYGIATRLISRHRRDELRFFQAIARTGVDPASEALDGQAIDRVAAQAARPELAAALTRLSQGQRDVLLPAPTTLTWRPGPTRAWSASLARAASSPASATAGFSRRSACRPPAAGSSLLMAGPPTSA